MRRTKFRSIRRRKKIFFGKKCTEEIRPRRHSTLTIPRAPQVVEDHQGQNDTLEANVMVLTNVFTTFTTSKTEIMLKSYFLRRNSLF